MRKAFMTFAIVLMLGTFLIMIGVGAYDEIKDPTPACGIVIEKHSFVKFDKTEYKVSVSRSLPTTVNQNLWNEIKLGDFFCNNRLYREVTLTD